MLNGGFVGSGVSGVGIGKVGNNVGDGVGDGVRNDVGLNVGNGVGDGVGYGVGDGVGSSANTLVPQNIAKHCKIQNNFIDINIQDIIFISFRT